MRGGVLILVRQMCRMTGVWENIFLFFISLTVGTSRVIEAQMDLPLLLRRFSDFYSDASNVFVLS